MSEVLAAAAPSSALASLVASNTFHLLDHLGNACGISPLYTGSTGETIALVRYLGLASSIVAHFVHRMFTFDGRRDVSKTVLGAISVYAVGMMGSTLTYDSMLNLFEEVPIRLLFLINIAVWGLFTWASMRWLVFGYTRIEEE